MCLISLNTLAAHLVSPQQVFIPHFSGKGFHLININAIGKTKKKYSIGYAHGEYKRLGFQEACAKKDGHW